MKDSSKEEIHVASWLNSEEKVMDSSINKFQFSDENKEVDIEKVSENSSQFGDVVRGTMDIGKKLFKSPSEGASVERNQENNTCNRSTSTNSLVEVDSVFKKPTSLLHERLQSKKADLPVKPLAHYTGQINNSRTIEERNFSVSSYAMSHPTYTHHHPYTPGYVEQTPSESELRMLKSNGHAPFIEELPNGKLVKRIPRHLLAPHPSAGHVDKSYRWRERHVEHLNHKQTNSMEMRRQELLLNLKTQADISRGHLRTFNHGPSSELYKRLTTSKHVCNFCKLPATNLCAGCQNISYCNFLCQKKDWRYHRDACRI